MPVRDVVFHDARLEGRTPTGSTFRSYRVDARTPLANFVVAALTEYFSAPGDIRIKILAHGYHQPGSQGGSGIQFCQEDIKLSTLTKLNALRGYVNGGIELFSCGAAYITPGSNGGDGDGNVLCSRLAQTVQCSVRASTATQYYSNSFLFWDTDIDFGQWEGTVLTYGPRGNVASVEQAPDS
jgi:hypothetical protein